MNNPGEALGALAKVADRPIVTDPTSFIGQGATGGFVLSAKGIGGKIARRFARILGGEAASHIPIAVDAFEEADSDAESQAILPRGPWGTDPEFIA